MHRASQISADVLHCTDWKFVETVLMDSCIHMCVTIKRKQYIRSWPLCVLCALHNSILSTNLHVFTSNESTRRLNHSFHHVATYIYRPTRCGNHCGVLAAAAVTVRVKSPFPHIVTALLPAVGLHRGINRQVMK